MDKQPAYVCNKYQWHGHSRLSYIGNLVSRSTILFCVFVCVYDLLAYIGVLLVEFGLSVHGVIMYI